MSKYNNCVIQCKTREHGEEIIEWWQSQSVYTSDYCGASNAKNGDKDCYYGLHNGKFANYTMDYVLAYSLMIIGLPTETKPDIKFDGIKVCVGDTVILPTNEDSKGHRIRRYFSSNIPYEHINHGSERIICGNTGIVRWVSSDFKVAAVEFIDEHNDAVCLGFNLSDLAVLKSQSSKNFNNNKNENQNEKGKIINVQRTFGTVTSGKRYSGSRLFGRRCKTAITVGHLSNKEIIGC